MRAADDERRHAARIGWIAKKRGGAVFLPESLPHGVRPIVEVALENAVEGCAHETLGAMVAHVQAVRALDPDLRWAMRAIAKDETEHAVLAWQAARWFDSQLDAQDRLRVERARLDAVELAEARACNAIGTPLRTLAGLPSPRVARQLAHGLRRLGGTRRSRAHR